MSLGSRTASSLSPRGRCPGCRASAARIFDGFRKFGPQCSTLLISSLMRLVLAGSNCSRCVRWCPGFIYKNGISLSFTLLDALGKVFLGGGIALMRSFHLRRMCLRDLLSKILLAFMSRVVYRTGIVCIEFLCWIVLAMMRCCSL